MNTFVVFSQETIQFPSKDGLLITADLYKNANSKKYILLFHQAGWSRGEYKEIAPWLVKMGFNCLAIDQRSGNQVNGVINYTHKRAKERGLPGKYIDAYPDIEATIAYIIKNQKPEKLLIWGSSYSSSLVLKYAGVNPKKIDGVLAFSPGEYFGSSDFIAKSARNIQVPVFITSAKNEEKNWRPIFNSIPGNKKQYFLPETKGNHGARALWDEFPDSKAYRDVVQQFLKAYL